MGRKNLQKKIQACDQQLAVDIGLLKLDGRERMVAIKRVPMLWWIVGGVGAGLVLGRIAAGQSPMVLASKGMSLFRFASFALPGSLGDVAAASPEP